MQTEWCMYPVTQPHKQEIQSYVKMKQDMNLKKISLVDQFPHTAHIETVVLFEKC